MWGIRLTIAIRLDFLILNKKILVLASTSRYRAELLARLQFPFQTFKPTIDESPLPGEQPRATALRLAISKAKSARATFPQALIIGADQVADLDGRHIGKPGARAAAILQLQAMRNRQLIFHSGICLFNTETGQIQSQVVSTTVHFRNYSDSEMAVYLDREDALDCAGSAKSEGLGVALMSCMTSDDPTALIGLPLIALNNMLLNEGVQVLA